MLSSSLNYHSLKAMLLRSTTLTAGRDFRRQGREVGGFCSQTQSASFLLASLTASGCAGFAVLRQSNGTQAKEHVI